MSDARPFWRRPLHLGWAAVVLVGTGLLCLLPLTETVGYELSLGVSLLCSLAAGHLAAIHPALVRERAAPFPGASHPVAAMYARVAAMGLSLTAVALAVALANTLRVPQCNLAQGLVFFAAMPVASVLLAAAIGLACGLATPGPRTALALWLAVWLGSIAAAFARFHSTPAVFSFGPFFGYFPGVLYDTLIEPDSRLATYRAVGLVHGALALFASGALLDPTSLRLRLTRLKTPTRSRVVAAVLVAASIALAFASFALGHTLDRGDLLAALPIERRAGDGLVLHFSQAASPSSIGDMVDDARFDLHMVETYLEAPSGPPIDVFVFDDEGHRGALLGAFGTNVAKPWRSEVYVLLEPSPHEVLRHELAHAVAARFGRGPFAIAGAANGLVPNPGLIEGVAVAAQGPRTDLTPHQWAAAMKRAGILPPIERLFGLGFLGLHASTAYTAAGSFCDWVHREHGAKALRDIYGGATWEDATGRGLDDLADGWHRFLDGIALGPRELAAARDRFDRPSVIGSVCVHEVARLHREARRQMDSERYDEGLALLEAAARRSGDATIPRFALFNGTVRAGREDEIRRTAAALLDDPSTGRVRRAEILETLADLDVERSVDHAATELRALAKDAADDADRRRLETKGHLAALRDDRLAPLLRALARVPGPKAPSEPLLMLEIAEAAAALPDDSWLAYLVARQRHRLGDHDKAARALRAFLEDGADETSASVALSARMMLGVSQYRLGRFADAERIFDEIADDERLSAGARAAAADWAARCAFLRDAP